MSKAEFDSQKSDTESMFDFLNEGEGQRARRKASQTDSESPLPIIRTPVPISESGPLRAPGKGAPVAPPPQLTTPTAPTPDDDDLDFLGEASSTQPNEPKPVDLSSARSANKRQASDENVTRLRPRFVDLDAENPAPQTSTQRQQATQAPPAVAKPGAEDDLDFLGLDIGDDAEYGSDWQQHAGPDTNRPASRRQAPAYDEQYDDAPPKRRRWYLLAILLIVAGIGSFAFSTSPEWFTALSGKILGKNALQTVSPAPETADSAELNTVPSDGQFSEESNTVGEDQVSPTPNPEAIGQPVGQSPLMLRFRQELDRVETLVQEGALDEAEQAISSMDRTVYGYGAFEFSGLEARIESLRSGVTDPVAAQQNIAQSEVEDAQGAETAELQQARLAEDARLAEAARLEQTRLAEEARLADIARQEQIAQAEQARIAEIARLERESLAEQARLEDIARLEQTQLAEQSRLAAGAQIEQERLVEEARLAEVSRLEQIQLAEEARLAEVAKLEQRRLIEEARLTEVARVEEARLLEEERLDALALNEKLLSDRAATDRRIAEERAAIQRQQARERRLEEARLRDAERETARAAAQAEADARAFAKAKAAAEAKAVAESRVAAEARAAAELAAVSAGSDSTNGPVDTDQLGSLPVIQTITDDELQLVYRRFTNLKTAIEERDINAVVSLTQRSGIRVQQVMQLFENSVEIDTRIRNVSTRNASGEIGGVLQIRSIRRADGTVTQAPASLASITLTSKRDASGWSAIRW